MKFKNLQVDVVSKPKEDDLSLDSMSFGPDTPAADREFDKLMGLTCLSRAISLRRAPAPSPGSYGVYSMRHMNWSKSPFEFQTAAAAFAYVRTLSVHHWRYVIASAEEVH